MRRNRPSIFSQRFDEPEVLRMSDFTKNYNDVMRRHVENITKMAQAVQGIYANKPYMSMVQSVRKLSEGLQRVYPYSDHTKLIQSAQKITEVLSLVEPKVYYNQNTLNSMIKLAESLSKSSFVNIGSKELYEVLQKNFASQLKILKQKDLKKVGEKIRHSMPDIDAVSFNLQRAAKAVQISEYKNSDEIDDEIYDEYSSDIEHILDGELTDEEIVEKNEKSEGKLAKLLYRIIVSIVTTFFAGYLQYTCEPVYKLINKVIVKEDISDLSKEVGNPAKGTKFTVWAKKDGYVEISYEDENGSIQGYISEDDFNNKSELVQDALDEEQMVFISKCMLCMSKYWNVDSDETYKRLNKDFDIIKEYIMLEYDRLVELTDEELVLDIDREYKKRQNTKPEDEFQKAGNYSDDELRFVVFCIESLAEDMNVDPIIVHDALTKESDIVDQYIIPCYETLHTQGKEYIVENLKEVMEERGIVL